MTEPIKDPSTSFDLVPELVFDRSVLLTYISRRQDDLNKLSESFNSGALDEFRKIGHRILGSARTYGFPELDAIARRMHDMPVAQAKELAPQILVDLKHWIESTAIQIG